MFGRVGLTSEPKPAWGLVASLAFLSLAAPAVARAETEEVRGRVVDAMSKRPLAGAVLEVVLEPKSDSGDVVRLHAVSDSGGNFVFRRMAAGTWRIRVSQLGYDYGQMSISVPLEVSPVQIELQPQPVVMDEMIVRGRAAPEEDYAAAFVEVIPVADKSAISLAEILDRSTGVSIRRYGGLGSFSTVSIRGSTAEQVLVFLDGVPLNHAVGGAVDMGRLPVSGVESVEIYRGAVPARYGGNSIGGVVHIRTQSASMSARRQISATIGSFGTTLLTGSFGRRSGNTEFFGLLDYGTSRSDFRFFDDNGTEYNKQDDEWVKRRNSDFRSLRALGNVRRAWGRSRVRLRNAFDLKYQGVPGLGNFQALRARSDGWRNITELEIFGSVDAGVPGGYRMVGYHALQRDAYRDPDGEVGTGVQEDRNDSRATGLRAELNILLSRALVSGFAALRRETFSPEDLLRPESRLLGSRRRSATAGLETEVPLADRRVRVVAGGQAEVIDDALAPGYHGETRIAGQAEERQSNRQGLIGGRIGGRAHLARGLHVKWHRGIYERAPSFYELFGDRGALVGNRDLRSERGDNSDFGVVYEIDPTRRDWRARAELSLFSNNVKRLIRFVQNSQYVSRPHNIGKARIRGIETRAMVKLGETAGMDARYAYQNAENRSSFPHERGNDLPNAPRHIVHVNADLSVGNHDLRYELSRESQHFLDKANLREVPGRFVHSAVARRRLWAASEFKLEVRNLTDDQVVDLWGYPLPGRSLFVSVTQRGEHAF